MNTGTVTVWRHYCKKWNRFIDQSGDGCIYCGVPKEEPQHAAPIQPPKFSMEDDVSRFSKALAVGIHENIRKEIESQLLESVMPKIKQIAADVAHKATRDLSTHITRDPLRLEPVVNVAFNGEIFKKEQL